MTGPTPAGALKAEEPLPCPFCGKDATVIITDVRPCNVPGWTDAFSVWCRDSVKCSGRIPRLYQTRDAAIAAWNTRPTPDAGEVRTYRDGVEREAKAIWMALEGRFLADEWQDAVWAGTSKSTILNLPEEDILAEDGSVYDSPVKKFGRASYMAAAAAIRKLP